MQQGQLISSFWEALFHQTTNDPVQINPQNSQVYQGESVISPIMRKNYIIIILLVVLVSFECNFIRPKLIKVNNQVES
jgi:hypothetical protein